MDLKIKSESKNEVLKRKEIIAEIDAKVLPTKEELRQKISALVSSPVEATVITKVERRFGTTHALVFANAYENADVMKKEATDFIMKRNFKELKAEKKADNDAPASFKK